MKHLDIVADSVTLTETAYVKVNLALHVRARRVDGYHELESLFVFAENGDRLAARCRDDGVISLTVDGPFGAGLSSGDDNLVLRAARALQLALKELRGASINLTKTVPVASGIGGGSADAAATLRLLLRLWDARMDDDALLDLALKLGSDVPACLASVTQMVTGRGEGLARHDVAGLDHMPMLLVNPGVGVSTGPVFAGWDRVDRGPLDGGSLRALVDAGRNDLEASAIALAPQIAQVTRALWQYGDPVVVRMSGSGATCFALYPTVAAATMAAEQLQQHHPEWWIMQTRIKS